MDFLTGSMLAATALKIGGELFGASSARRQADLRAEALKAAAKRRIEKSQIEASQIQMQARMDQTTYATRALSSGAQDRLSLAQDSSLSEITNRASFMADQVLSDARIEADNMIADGSAYQQAAKDQTTAAWLGTGSSILSGYKWFSDSGGMKGYAERNK